jgi:hypothetical protein
MIQAITETTSPKKLKRQRRRLNNKIKRARTLKVEFWQEDFVSVTYKVIGENDHLVKISKIEYVTCDCNNALSPCSHVIAVRMFRGEWNEKDHRK